MTKRHRSAIIAASPPCPATNPRCGTRAVIMPRIRTKVCACISCPAHPGSCPELTTTRHCGACAAEYERKRGTRQARGYDRAYDLARKRWAPKVAACTVQCHAPVCVESVRLILPMQAWDLGHDQQRNIRGPEHATCNRSAGGKASHSA